MKNTEIEDWADGYFVDLNNMILPITPQIEEKKIMSKEAPESLYF